jgi:hypothetical protein
MTREAIETTWGEDVLMGELMVSTTRFTSTFPSPLHQTHNHRV